MRLGSSILGGKPMRIPGIVDVYQVGDEWVARSWPKVQNQPNSAAQLLWRQKFRDAKAKIKSFRGAYLRAWQEIECPPGKMWIDIAIHSFLMRPLHFADIPDVDNVKLECYFSVNGFDIGPNHWDYKYAWCWNSAAWTYQSVTYGMFTTAGSKWDQVLQWVDLGWICPKGKRPKKHWKLVWKYNHVLWDDWVFPVINGQQCYVFFYNYLPDGMTMLRNYDWAAYLDFGADYALSGPPLYSPVKTWPGSFTP